MRSNHRQKLSPKAMETKEFLSILIPAIVTFLLGLLPTIVAEFIDRKYAPVVSAALTALSPVLADNTKEYGGYGVRKIVGDTIAAIDKRLDIPEVGTATELALRKFDPAIAASKPETPVSQAISQAIAQTDGDISKLDLSRIRWNFSIGNN